MDLTKIKVNVCNKRVLLKKLVNTMDKKYGDILIPHNTNKNYSLNIAKIIGIGDEAKEQSGLDIGQYVLFDHYSAYGHNSDVVIVNWENIIFQLTEDEANKFKEQYVIN